MIITEEFFRHVGALGCNESRLCELYCPCLLPDELVLIEVDEESEDEEPVLRTVREHEETTRKPSSGAVRRGGEMARVARRCRPSSSGT